MMWLTILAILLIVMVLLMVAILHEYEKRKSNGH